MNLKTVNALLEDKHNLDAYKSSIFNSELFGTILGKPFEKGCLSLNWSCQTNKIPHVFSSISQFMLVATKAQVKKNPGKLKSQLFLFLFFVFER